jgi:hypothetical protein
MKNSKAKGSGFERECARTLSLWWSDGIRDDLVWRTSGSGATHTTRAKKGKQTEGQAGDLCATNAEMIPFFNFFLVECKSGYRSSEPLKSIDPLCSVDSPRSHKTPPLLIQWFLKADKERAVAERKTVMIIFKRTGKEPCVMLRSGVLPILTDMFGFLPGSCLNIRHSFYKENKLKQPSQSLNLTIFSLKTFIDWANSEAFKTYGK